MPMCFRRAEEVEFKDLSVGDAIYIADLPLVGHGKIRLIRNHVRDGWEIKMNWHARGGKPAAWNIGRVDWLILSRFDGVARYNGTHTVRAEVKQRREAARSESDEDETTSGSDENVVIADYDEESSGCVADDNDGLHDIESMVEEDPGGEAAVPIEHDAVALQPQLPCGFISGLSVAIKDL